MPNISHIFFSGWMNSTTLPLCKQNLRFHNFPVQMLKTLTRTYPRVFLTAPLHSGTDMENPTLAHKMFTFLLFFFFSMCWTIVLWVLEVDWSFIPSQRTRADVCYWHWPSSLADVPSGASPCWLTCLTIDKTWAKIQAAVWRNCHSLC